MKDQTFIQWFFKSTLRKESPFERILVHTVLIVTCLIALYPALRVLTISLRPGNRVLSTTLEIIPPDASFENYKAVLLDKDFLRWLWNSLVITCSTSVIGVILASTSAYAFSRWNFPGRTGGLIFLQTREYQTGKLRNQHRLKPPTNRSPTPLRHKTSPPPRFGMLFPVSWNLLCQDPHDL